MILNEQSDFLSYGSNAKNHIMFGIAYAPYLRHVKVIREKNHNGGIWKYVLFLEAISSIYFSICLGHIKMVLFATVTPVTVSK